jgi:hypothetical protein
MPKRGDSEGMSPNVMLAVGLAVCAALVIVAFVGARFLKSAPPPPPPPVAPSASQSVNTTLKYSAGYYKALLDDDAKRFKIPVPPVEVMQAPLPYFEELSAPREMKAEKDQFDTPHLHLATRVSKEWAATGDAARLRVEHLVLAITNKSERPIAYRVETHLPDTARCKRKGALAQNAIALRPGETIQRTECMWGKGMSLQLTKIEVLELPDLGYFYVSRLIPGQVLLDERPTAGHEPPAKLKPCAFVPWREIRAAAGPVGGVGWADVLDFYARHSCEEYSFFSSYRRWQGPGQLPAQP